MAEYFPKLSLNYSSKCAVNPEHDKFKKKKKTQTHHSKIAIKQREKYLKYSKRNDTLF